VEHTEWCQLYRSLFHNNIQQGNEVSFKSYFYQALANFPLTIKKMLVNKDADLSSNLLQSSHDKLMPLSPQ